TRSLTAKPRGEVNPFAENRVVESIGRTHPTCHHISGGQSDPDLQFIPGALVKPVAFLNQARCTFCGILRVVAARHGRAKNRDEQITDKIVQNTLMLFYYAC